MVPEAAAAEVLVASVGVPQGALLRVRRLQRLCEPHPLGGLVLAAAASKQPLPGDADLEELAHWLLKSGRLSIQSTEVCSKTWAISRRRLKPRLHTLATAIMVSDRAARLSLELMLTRSHRGVRYLVYADCAR